MPYSSNKLSQFWKELKRRKVTRVITVYAASAFVILQLVEILVPSLRLPEWTMNFILVLLIVGFIIAVILSWIYDIHPEGGIVRTAPAHEERLKDTRTSSISWKIATYVSLIIIIGLIALNILSRKPGSKIDESIEKSIAVLPFENWSYDEEFAHLGEAMADEIILQLQYISEFDRIISRTSTIRYKDSDKSIPQIAGELGVNYIIEGSIQPHMDEVSIRVQVIQCTVEDHIWADEFNGKWSDIFFIQDEIAKEVANELKAVLSPEEIDRIDKKPTSVIEAYDLYLLGRDHWNKRTQEGILKSIEYFEKAIRLDEEYALAYSGLADAYYIAADWNFLDVEASVGEAEKYALKAISLDEMLAEPYATLAGITDYFKKEHELAEILYKYALRLNPSYASGYQWYALYLIRNKQNEQALEHMKKALELDPFSMIINYAFGLLYYYAEDFERSLSQFNKTLEIFPEFRQTWLFKFHCFLEMGKELEALHAYELHIVNEQTQNNYKDKVYRIFDDSGIEAALKYIIELEVNSKNPDYRLLAVLYALTGNIEKALDQIEYNARYHVSEFAYIHVEPAFEKLRNEPRFQAVIRDSGYDE